MNSIGDTLRLERQRQGLRLEEVAAQTKIGSYFLRAMEENRFDRLPGGLFTRSFVRQYTRTLGLDENEVVASFKQQFEEPPLPLPLPPPPSRSHIPQLPAFGWLFVTLLICGGTYSLWENVRRSMPTTKAPAPPAGQHTARGVGSNEIAREAATASRSVEFSGSGSLSRPSGQPTVPVASTGSEDTIHALFTATEEVWISVKSDGTPIFTGILEAQQSREIAASGKTTVLVGNAGGLRVFVNGTPVPPVGAHGQVQLLLLTANGAKIVPRTTSIPPQAPVEPARQYIRDESQ